MSTTPTVHNPENVPQSAVPPGWRFMWRHEVGALPEGTKCRVWGRVLSGRDFTFDQEYKGNLERRTYIVPADFHLPGDPLHALPDTSVTHTAPASRRITHMSVTLETSTNHLEILVLCDDNTWWSLTPGVFNEWKHLPFPPIPQP